MLYTLLSFNKLNMNYKKIKHNDIINKNKKIIKFSIKLIKKIYYI